MIPLADRMRPKLLKDYIGQKHLLGRDKLLFKTIKSGNLFSMILWGPPGVGKTTLARVIANELQTELIEFSAVTASIAEIKKLFEDLRKQRDSGIFQTQGLELVFPKNSLFDKNKVPNFPSSVANHLKSKKSQNTAAVKKTNVPIIFIDEIHRFNKAQQDAFLPYVENGTIILIGATTENPSFEVIGPLLSRTRVLMLNPLSREELVSIVDLALKDQVNGLGQSRLRLSKEGLDLLIDLSGGDARIMLNTLEIAANMAVDNVDTGMPDDISVSSVEPQIKRFTATQNAKNRGQTAVTKREALHGKVGISKELIEEAFQKKALMYDKAGDEHYNTISAFIKSMRASNLNASLYYLARMVEAGEDPLFIARRMVIFASEDIGMAQPTALVVANEVFRACETIGYPECQINLAHGVVYLASAKKDRSAYEGYLQALRDVKTMGNLPIPLNLRNAPTKLLKELGYGQNYEMYTNQDLLPAKLKGKRYYSAKKS